LNVDASRRYEVLKIVVTNILEVDEKPHDTVIVETSRHAVPLVISIQCPECGETLYLNKHWNGYFCSSSTHPRKVYEIQKVYE